MTRRMLLLLLVLVACSCADDVAIAPNVCGNWVLEAGEDCDRPGGVCTEDCRVRCDPAQSVVCASSFDGACCPGGFACGVDQTCHAPTGTFAVADISIPIAFTDFRIGDIDGDGIGDAVGIRNGGVVALFGARGAPFLRSVVRTAPPSTGVPAVGDYTGDGRLDVVWPVAGGLAAFVTTSGLPEPVPFSFAVTPRVDHLRIASTTDAAGADLVRLDFDGDTQRIVIGDDRGGTIHAPCGHQVSDPTLLGGRALHPFDEGTDVLVPISLGAMSVGGPPFLCLDGPGILNGAFVAAPLGSDTARIGEAFLVKLDPAAPCADVLLPVSVAGTAALARFPRDLQGGFCVVGQGAIAMVGAPLAPLRLANGQTAIVTSTGVVAADPGCGLCEVQASTREWHYAVVADLDGDGLDDFAVASDDAHVEVFFQSVTGWSTTDIVVDGAATQIVSGDFDGDGVQDLVIATGDPGDPAPTHLHFAYGSMRRFTIAGNILTIPAAHGIATTQRVDPGLSPGIDHNDDLAIVGGDHGDGTLTYVYGSSDRQPTAPATYEGQFHGGFTFGEGRVALVGGFGLDNGPGIFGIFSPAPSLGGTVPSGELELAQLAGDEHAISTDRSGVGIPCKQNNFCPLDATWLAVATTGGPLVLGFPHADDNADCGAFYQSSLQSVPALRPLDCTGLTGAAVHKTVTRARSLGGQLIALSSPQAATPELTIFEIDATAGMPSFDNAIDVSSVVSMAIAMPAQCFDAVGIELGTRAANGASFGAASEVAVACRVITGTGPRTEVFAIYAPVPPTPGPFVAHLFDLPGDQPIELEVGDVDGDGVQDLVYETSVDGVGSLRVRLQCDTHTSCAGS